MNIQKRDDLKTLVQVFVNAVQAEGILLTVYKTMRYPFLPLLRKRAARNHAMIAEVLKSPAIGDRFRRIHSLNYWSSTESISGKGSTINSTKNLRRNLPILFKQFSVKKLLDAPCGDFNWMRLVMEDCEVEYIGADIVPELIEQNTARYTRANTRFVQLDITNDELPQTDLWICRDCLFHLSFEDTRKALVRFVGSNTPYILTTTFKNPGKFENRDIATGDFRFIDLFSKPYDLPRDVLFRVDDYTGRHQKEMCLWSRDQIVESLKVFV